MREHVPCPTCHASCPAGWDLTIGGFTLRCRTHGWFLVPPCAPPEDPPSHHLRHVKVEAICAWPRCQKPFQARAAQPGKYCSIECRHEQTKANRRAARAANPKRRFTVWAGTMRVGTLR